MKKEIDETLSILFPKKSVEVIRKNSNSIDSLITNKNNVYKSAMKLASLSDEELWGLVIEPDLLRSHMVWSDGYCPNCKKDVPMYDWIIDPNNKTWKVTCPHCKDVFPKNDFLAFYKSGIGNDGRFSYEKADNSLLYNKEHPDQKDPLHKYGVDDGRGYNYGVNTWYFTAAYNVHGNWTGFLYPGIKNLAEAYILTGEKLFAHKCGIILDRLADVYGEYDFATQGKVYEDHSVSEGYISYRVDAAFENLDLGIAFDKIRDGIKEDKELILFLNKKSLKGNFKNKKENIEDIFQNIKIGLLQEIIDHGHKFRSNYPHEEIAILINKIILHWPLNREKTFNEISQIINNSTKKDGLSGEGGSASYAAFTKNAINGFLEEVELLEDGKFINEIIEKHPLLKKMYAFHVDILCLNRYYPNTGDSGRMGIPYDSYQSGGNFDFFMLWKLYKETKDVNYLKAIYISNGMKAKGFLDAVAPHSDNLEETYDEVQQVIDKEGCQINQGSINKEAWGIGVLRAGLDENRRALWMFHGKSDGHEHRDYMSIGLFTKNLELIADIGYPEVGFGGWDSVIAGWAKHGFSHNKGISNRRENVTIPDKTTLFAKGEKISAIRAQGEVNDFCNQYERTLALININEEDSYFIDISRINTTEGNYEMFIKGFAGTATIEGIELEEKDLEFTDDIFLKNFNGQEKVKSGWNMDLEAEDFFGVNEPNIKPKFNFLFEKKERSGQWVDRKVHLKYTGLSCNADVYVGECLTIHYVENKKIKELWIPVAIERKMGFENKTGTFAGIYEPYEDNSNIVSISRLDLQYGSGKESEDINIAANVKLKDGNEDLILSFDIASKDSNNSLVQPDWKVETDCELCVIRKDKKGSIIYIAACKGTYIIVGEDKYRFKQNDMLKEIYE